MALDTHERKTRVGSGTWEKVQAGLALPLQRALLFHSSGRKCEVQKRAWQALAPLVALRQETLTRSGPILEVLWEN